MSKTELSIEEYIKDFNDNVRVQGEIEFPIEISAVEINNGRIDILKEVGSWVSIRPCDNEKTYLGVYLGYMMFNSNHHYHLKTKVLKIVPFMNPAIYVPDLKRVVWGCESWWGIIRKPEELRKITDSDIQNVWYMKALVELSEQQPAPPSDED